MAKDPEESGEKTGEQGEAAEGSRQVKTEGTE